MGSEYISEFKSVNDVGLNSEYEESPGHNYNEEEKVPNISKTRINDAS